MRGADVVPSFELERHVLDNFYFSLLFELAFEDCIDSAPEAKFVGVYLLLVLDHGKDCDSC